MVIAVANCFAQGWRALMSLAFIPLYLHYLGTDAIGLIGLFALLQAWLVAFDLAMRPILERNAVGLSPFPLQGGRFGWGSVPVETR